MLRWYPHSWRARYGGEFAEFLASDYAERPRDWRRAADVARCGLLARLSAAGLAGHPLDRSAGERACLAALACAAGTFVMFGATMWAQLTVGWQWAPPTRTTAVAIVVMSGALLLLAVLAAAAAVPLVVAVVSAIRRRQVRGLRWPASLALGGIAVLVVGGRHFGNGWPGTGGHWWPHQGLVPGGLAAFGWACTLSVTSYWAHPAALASFPALELAWMALSPLAAGCLVTGAAVLVRRVKWVGRAIRYEAIVGSAAVGGMTVFLSGAFCWVILGDAGPRGLFHAGAIDAAGLGVMAAAVALGGQAVRGAYRARQAGAGL